MHITRHSLILIALTAGFTAHAATPTTLDAYLTQVRENHTGYRGALEKASGLEQRSKESSLLFYPTGFASAQYGWDEAPKLMPSAQGTKTESKIYTLGISQTTNFGTTGKLYYLAALTDMSGTSPQAMPTPRVWDMRPTLELSQSLWRNFLGRESRATVEAGEEQVLASALMNRYAAKGTLATAEGTYWRLSAAREALLIAKDSVARATKIRDWNANRAKLQLADQSDLLQAEAGLQLRQLELQNTIDEERAAATAFNAQRGINSEKVDDELIAISAVDLNQVALPKRAVLRDDVKAAMHAEKALAAAATIGAERNRPNVEAYGTLALNGHNPDSELARKDSFTTQYPTTTVGLKLTVPLNFGLTADSREGYRREADGARKSYERTLFEQDKDWVDLTYKYNEAKHRLALAKQIEEIQKSKYAREKERHSRGRTTTYLVIQFEQDYASAGLVRVRAQAEVLGLIAQLKTFEGDDK